MERDHQFEVDTLFHMEHEVLYRLVQELGLTTSFVLLRLCDEQMRGDRHFYARQDVLSQDLSMSVSTVQREIKELQRRGLLRIVQSGIGSPNLYRLNIKAIRRLFEDSGEESVSIGMLSARD